MAQLKKKHKNICVYLHLDEKTNNVIYVGSGSLNRARNITRPKYLEFIKKNGKPKFKILKTFSDRDKAYTYETMITKYYKGLDQAQFNERIGNQWDEKNKQKLSQIHKGKILTPQWKENIRKSHLGEKNHFYGKKHSEQTKQIIAEKIKKLDMPPMKGKKHSLESRIKMSISQKASMSFERRLKMRLCKLGKKPINSKEVVCLNTGIIYKSTADAAKDTGCSQSKIVEVCNDKYLHTKNFKFKYIENLCK